MAEADFQDRFNLAAEEYRRLFGDWPPVHLATIDLGPDTVCQMVERANARGAPITDDDYPPTRTDVVY